MNDRDFWVTAIASFVVSTLTGLFTFWVIIKFFQWIGAL